MRDKNLHRVADLDNNWQDREARRMETEYERLPTAWYDWLIPEHYAHRSLKDAKMVSFTVDAEKGMRDRQTVMNVGRYLTRYYQDRFTSDEIRSFVCEVTPSEVQFAVTADEIAAVYERGPRSCMAGTNFFMQNRQLKGFNPVRIYAGHDLQLAYIGSPEGGYAARVLVWPEQKKFGRIYGDYDRMVRGLTALGFTESGSLNGAKVARHVLDLGEGKKALAMPYVDGSVGMLDEGEHCVLIGHDTPNCHDIFNRDNFLNFEGQSACRTRYWTECELTGVKIVYGQQTEMLHMADGRRYRTLFSVVQERGWQSSCSGTWYDNAIEKVTVNGKLTMTQAEYDRYYQECTFTGQRVHVNKLARLHDGRLVHRDASFTCAYSGDRYLLQDRVVLANGEQISRQHMRERSVIDVYTGESWPSSGCYRLADGTYARRTLFACLGYTDEDGGKWKTFNDFCQRQLPLQAAE